MYMYDKKVRCLAKVKEYWVIDDSFMFQEICVVHLYIANLITV